MLPGTTSSSLAEAPRSRGEPLFSGSALSCERKQLLPILLRWAFYRLQDGVCLLSTCDRRETGAANEDNNNNFHLEMELLLLWLLVKFFPMGDKEKAFLRHCASEKNKVLINPGFVCFVDYSETSNENFPEYVPLPFGRWRRTWWKAGASLNFWAKVQCWNPTESPSVLNQGNFKRRALKEEASRVWLRNYNCH